MAVKKKAKQPPRKRSLVLGNILNEQNQGHATRIRLYDLLEKALGRPVVSFATSFHHPVVIEDDDVGMLADLLQTMDLRNGLALLISSPGGSGLAAERIVNTCRQYSGTGEYWAIVHGMAKSASTMICIGASQVYMGPASELGPIDPQIPLVVDGRTSWFSAWNVIRSYKNLFNRAVRAKGNLEPYILQLRRYDEREISDPHHPLTPPP